MKQKPEGRERYKRVSSLNATSIRLTVRFCRIYILAEGLSYLNLQCLKSWLWHCIMKLVAITKGKRVDLCS